MATGKPPRWGLIGPSDGALARAAAAGDHGAFAGIYDRYADRLQDFCVGMVRDRDTAADCVHDTFCTVAAQLQTLREPDKLRAWLYAIARDEALRALRDRREQTSDELPDPAWDEVGPELVAARTELADLIAAAAGGLSDRDNAVLELAYRHGLDGRELAQALGVSQTDARAMTQRLRKTIERSLGALLVARRARNGPIGCIELAGIVAGWDGEFTVLMRKHIDRHIESCPSCDRLRRRLVAPRALLGVPPVFIPAPAWLRDQTLNLVALNRVDALGEADARPHDERPDLAHSARVAHRLRLVAMVGAAMFAAVGVSVAALAHHSPDIAATVANSRAPIAIAPVPAAPPAANPAPAETLRIATPPVGAGPKTTPATSIEAPKLATSALSASPSATPPTPRPTPTGSSAPAAAGANPRTH